MDLRVFWNMHISVDFYIMAEFAVTFYIGIWTYLQVPSGDGVFPDQDGMAGNQAVIEKGALV